VLSIGVIVLLLYLLSVCVAVIIPNEAPISVEILITGIMITAMGTAEILPEGYSKTTLTAKLVAVGCGVYFVVLLILVFTGLVSFP